MTRTNLPALAALAGLAVAAGPGCSLVNGDETYTPRCAETVSSLTLDQATDLGFTAQELISSVTGGSSDTLTWSDGTTTGVHLGVGYADGALRYVHSEVEEPPEDAGAILDIAVICEDRIEVVADVTLKTDDGAFDEMWTVTLRALASDEASFNQDLLPGDLTGTYDYRALDPAEYDSTSAALSVSLRTGISTGNIFEMGEKTEGDGDDGTSSATSALAGAWPGE